MGYNLPRSLLATPSPKEGRGAGRLQVNVVCGAKALFFR
jgi:hypothetical protein